MAFAIIGTLYGGAHQLRSHVHTCHSNHVKVANSLPLTKEDLAPNIQVVLSSSLTSPEKAASMRSFGVCRQNVVDMMDQFVKFNNRWYRNIRRNTTAIAALPTEPAFVAPLVIEGTLPGDRPVDNVDQNGTSAQTDEKSSRSSSQEYEESITTCTTIRLAPDDSDIKDEDKECVRVVEATLENKTAVGNSNRSISSSRPVYQVTSSNRIANINEKDWFPMALPVFFPAGRGAPWTRFRTRFLSVGDYFDHLMRDSSGHFQHYLFVLYAYDHVERTSMNRASWLQCSYRSNSGNEDLASTFGKLDKQSIKNTMEYFKLKSACKQKGVNLTDETIQKLNLLETEVTSEGFQFMKSVSAVSAYCRHSQAHMDDNRIKMQAMQFYHGKPTLWYVILL
jgi:hypothetical protein